jgi:EmrB/QacA subfamily drug resistance transporter
MAALVFSQLVLPKDEPSTTEPFDFLGMLLLSPGLALFLFGVSSIAEGGEGASFGPRVWVSATIGVVLIVAFVVHALRADEPLIDLRLFANRRLTIATVAMAFFVIAFMGAGLLFPSYFLQVRGETALMAGLLLAPQGLGAMVTMPLAGVLADRVPIGRTVPVALLIMAAGFFAFTQVTADTSYWVLCGALFVMGLGMGGTMMPIMTAALKSLADHEVARGSTVVNIVQQIGGSIGTAVLSVVLTNQLTSRPSGPGEPLEFLADGFAATFTVAFVLVLFALIPVAFLPRAKEPSHLLDAGDGAAPAPILLH